MLVLATILASARALAPMIPPAQVDLTPPKMVWPGVVIIILIALFVTAAVTGPLIRANSDDPESSPPPLGTRDSIDE